MAHTLTNLHRGPGRRFGLTQFVSQAVAVWRQRRALESLDAAARRDLGLSEGQICLESRRPFWDVPQIGRF